MLFKPSAMPRSFMLRPPLRVAMTATAPAVSPTVPMLAVRARWRICDNSRAIWLQSPWTIDVLAARFDSSSARSPRTFATVR